MRSTEELCDLLESMNATLTRCEAAISSNEELLARPVDSSAESDFPSFTARLRLVAATDRLAGGQLKLLASRDLLLLSIGKIQEELDRAIESG